jgi:hypothetical protein
MPLGVYRVFAAGRENSVDGRSSTTGRTRGG